MQNVLGPHAHHDTLVHGLHGGSKLACLKCRRAQEAQRVPHLADCFTWESSLLAPTPLLLEPPPLLHIVNQSPSLQWGPWLEVCREALQTDPYSTPKLVGSPLPSGPGPSLDAIVSGGGRHG
jgi:hypothetical protein